MKGMKGLLETMLIVFKSRKESSQTQIIENKLFCLKILDCKHSSEDKNNYFHYPYCILRIKKHPFTTKERGLKEQFLGGKTIVVIRNLNKVHTFNHFGRPWGEV